MKLDNIIKNVHDNIIKNVHETTILLRMYMKHETRQYY